VLIKRRSCMSTASSVHATAGPREKTGSMVTWIALAATVGLMGILFADVLLDLASEWWTQPEASYGMLVPPMALYIAWLQRKKTLAFPAQPTLRGLWLVGFGCLVLLSGRLAGEFFLARMSFVLVLAGLAWTFWGADRLKTLAFPFVLLATMVPLPVLVYNAVAAPLQLLASSIATDLAQALGVSIYRDGNIIHLATTSLGVEEACSGLHSLPALMVGALLLGFLSNASMLGRILLLLISVPLAIAVNVLRVTGTAILADYRPEFAEGFYHSFSGWLVFVLGFGALWLIGQLFFKWTRKAS
jgi:exosortase